MKKFFTVIVTPIFATILAVNYVGKMIQAGYVPCKRCKP